MSDEPGQAAVRRIETGCVVVGGGPAGMMLSLLLARAGVATVLLEKHADFFRDFRGDTIHPSTLELMRELGCLEEFLRLPHDEMSTVEATLGGERFAIADFSGLPTRCKFIAFMPQWDFLNFLAERARAYPAFSLRMSTEATGLVEEGGRIVGVRATGPEGALDIRAPLVVGTDGRGSTVRRCAGLEVDDFSVPIDVLWCRIPKEKGSPRHTLGYFDGRQGMVLIDRGDYFQCGYIIPKGAFDGIRERGLPAFHAAIAALAPFAGEGAKAIDGWEKVRLLTVKIDRLRRWHRPGLLCIGDAAHAMSPAGGVGVNFAVQDAVAAANLLAGPLRSGAPIGEDLLRRVQRRREWPVRAIQAIQGAAHRRMTAAAGERQHRRPFPSAPVRWFLRHLLPRRLVGRLLGLGLRPEHVRTPEAR